jgi:phosphoribosylamine--glycine ligase
MLHAALKKAGFLPGGGSRRTMSQIRVLLVGAGGREHALGEALHRSEAQLYVAAPTVNPGLKRRATEYFNVSVEDGASITARARQVGAQLAVLGPDAAVASGVGDTLRAAGIPTVGPGREAAQIESSKAFAREFLARNGIQETPRFRIVRSAGDVEAAMADFGDTPLVVKPSGLTGGKGVLVAGVDFASTEEGRKLAKDLLQSTGQPVVLEERLEGEEFSLMAFVDGARVYPMPLVKDYKRALDGDLGGNTGGMGSFSTRDHLLPYVTASDRDQAVSVMERTVSAMRKEGLDYRGVLYGGFMATAHGPVLLEYNARFGDPEALNVLTVYDGTDFAPLLLSLAEGHLRTTFLQFRRRATVVKYLAPPGYGASPSPGGTLTVDEATLARNAITLYYGSVTPGPKPGTVVMGTSRAIALVGEASSLREALGRVEEGLASVRGDYAMRRDIATAIDLKKRTTHMESLRGGTRAKAPGKAENHTRSGPQPPQVFG